MTEKIKQILLSEISIHEAEMNAAYAVHDCSHNKAVTGTRIAMLQRMIILLNKILKEIEDERVKI